MPTGYIVRWNSEKGFGFIQPHDGAEEDVFCHVSDLQEGEGSVTEGDSVLYTEKWDDRKGKYRACEVELSAPGELHELSESLKKRKSERGRDKSGDRSRSRGRGGDRDRGERGGGAKRAPKSSGPGKETGTMVRWQSDKGFGFIKPDDGGEDLFAHVSALVDGDGGVADGDKVTYDKDYNERKGKDQAVNVKSTGEKGTIDSGRGRDRKDDRDRDRRRRSGSRSRGRRDRSKSRSRGRRERKDKSRSESRRRRRSSSDSK
eukprot:gb/GFBE01073113.1/.p1 GENE.gb/GFBE01073113.1/~~gb/GFBE01073113.1/.p1  ORF type:complete len:260 (+),score=41.36 gb/GFBE01073113.1/:1-780(+)